MTNASREPRKVLAVMDDSETQTALLSAAALAERHGAALEAIACVEPPHDLNVLARLAGRDTARLVEELHDRAAREMAGRLAAHLPGREIPQRVVVGKAFVEIIRYVIASGCDFVVKTAEPPSGIHRFLFQSTDQHLLRKCPRPVWLQTADARTVPKCVIAAVDVDVWDAAEPETLLALNRRVLDTARRVAAPSGAEVFALHAWDAAGEGLVWAFASRADAQKATTAYIEEMLDARHAAMSRLLDAAAADAAEDAAGTPAVPIVPRLVRGAPEQVIEQQARQLGADVVVMGTVARTGLGGVIIGNTAENIINNLECPVIAVKPDGFVSPLDIR